MSKLILYCRPGSESDLAAELVDRTLECGLSGFCRAKKGTAFVVFEAQEGNPEEVVRSGRLRLEDLVFARQMFLSSGPVSQLKSGGRVEPLVAALEQMGRPVADLFVERPDTEQGKELSAFCRKMSGPLKGGLTKAGLLVPDAKHRAHVLFVDSQTAWPGLALLKNCAPWPMGIMRLKFPRAAPSRSTLKLDEALLTLIPHEERAALLSEGMRAVDLGAAPGGWTYQLVRRGLWVTAVDNGDMDPVLLEGGMVEHLRVDGFHYQPPDPVDWLVCDMIEKPGRIAKLMASWIAQGWCRAAMFNLKLPMKKRHLELLNCRRIIEQVLGEQERAYVLRLKQLYHDRDEVTAYLRLENPR